MGHPLDRGGGGGGKNRTFGVFLRKSSLGKTNAFFFSWETQGAKRVKQGAGAMFFNGGTSFFFTPRWG